MMRKMYVHDNFERTFYGIAMANEAVLLPKEAEGVAGVFGMVVFSQLFACLLSLARGYNPDEPIGLSKTTVTF